MKLVVITLLFSIICHFSLADDSSESGRGQIGTNGKLANQCFIDICGSSRSPLQVISSDNSLWVQNEPLDKWLTESVDPLVDQMIRQNLELTRLHRKSLKKLIDKIEWKKLTQAERAVIFQAVIASIPPKKVNYSKLFILDQNGFRIHNESELENRYHHVSKKHRNLIIKSIIAIDKNTIFQFTNSLNIRLSLELLLEKAKMFFGAWKGKIDHVSWDSLENIALNLAGREVRQFLELGPLIREPSYRKIFLQTMNDGAITLSNLPIFIEALQETMKIDVVAFGSATPILASADLTPSQIKKLINLDERLNQRLNESSRIFQTYRSNLKKRFRRAIQVLIAAAPTDQEIKIAQENIGIVKNISIQFIGEMTNLTAAEITKTNETIEKLKIILPESREHLAASLLRDLSYRLDKYEEDLKNTKEILKRNSEFLPMLLVRSLDTLPEDRAHLLPALERYLNSLSPKTFENFTFNEIPTVELGWETVKFPNIGLGIIAHEMGHVVSGVIGPYFPDDFSTLLRLPTNDVMAAKICSARKHYHAENWNRKNPAFYIEEDWSDIFSTAIQKRLQNSMVETKNHFCAMITHFKVGEPQSNRSIQNNLSWDNHSPLIYRLIQSHMGLNALPESCLQFLNLPSENPFFESCDLSKRKKTVTPISNSFSPYQFIDGN